MTLLRDTSVAQSSNGLLVHVDQDGIVLGVDAEAAVTGLSKQQMQHLAGGDGAGEAVRWERTRTH
jgi:hypothetical protein